MKLALKTALAFAKEHGVDLTALAEYTKTFDDWVRETDEIHRMARESDDQADTSSSQRSLRSSQRNVQVNHAGPQLQSN